MSIFFTKDEILLIRQKKKDDVLPFIDPIVLKTLESYPSFNFDKFTKKLLENVVAENAVFNNKIDTVHKKLKETLNKESERIEKELGYYESIYTLVYDKMIDPINLNEFKNPVVEDMYDGYRSDISYDSSEYGNFDCWDLAKYTHSDENYLCLQDIFNEVEEWKNPHLTDNTWKHKDSQDIQIYMDCLKFLASVGFKCWFVNFSTWRKGYDYTVFDVDMISMDEYIKEYCVDDDKIFHRYYVSFNPIDYL